MKTIFNGPLVIPGNTNPQQVTDPDIGPSVIFQSAHVLDVRQVGGVESAAGFPGYKVYGMFTSPYVTMVDYQPVTLNAALISAAQAAASGVPFTLASTQATGRSISVPIVPFGSAYVPTSKVTPPIAIDFGFTTGTSTAASASITAIPAGAWRFFKKGQRIIIAGAGGTNLPLYTTVATTPSPGATTLAITDAAIASQSGAQIGSADPWGVGAAWPYVYYGTQGSDVALADPAMMLGRAVSVTGSASATGGNVTVVGYDVWGQPQTEVIAAPASATTVNGKKGFKYITSVTPAFTDAGHTYSMGTTDIMSFTMRAEFWEYLTIYYNGALITSSTGWLTADQTDPATTVTGDTRGTYALQSASDGSKRFTAFLRIPPYNLLTADNLGYKTLFGVTPV